MILPLNNRTESDSVNPVYETILTQIRNDSFEDGLAERLNVEQMFTLINSVLPIEACLHHQVLPLFLDGSRLHLGMVSLNDISATDYVRRIVSYLHYSVVSHQISSESLQSILSAYLRHSCEQTPPSAHLSKLSPPIFPGVERPPRKNRSKPFVDHNTQATLIVDSPEDLNEIRFNDAELEPSDLLDTAQPPPQLPFRPMSRLTPESPEPESLNRNPSLTQTATTLPSSQPHSKTEALGVLIEENSHESRDLSQEKLNPNLPQALPSSLLNPLPTLEINASHLTHPVEVLAQLPANQLLHELLGRTLIGGIGRLYLERQQQQGRVLWSQNGVLQSALDKVALSTFQGLISELKRMASLSLIPVEKPRHIELERMYDQSRILLRFRFMPGDHGEEATVQVLRGSALRFYQQQQLASLGRDALSITKQLQIKINEIRDRAQFDPKFSKSHLETLPAISQLLHHIEAQIGNLQNPDQESE